MEIVKANFKISRISNQRGNAMIETLPILTIFIFLLGFGLGFFGIVHTSIMNSMAARTYAFETFRNRSDLVYHRDIKVVENIKPSTYKSFGNRFHTVNYEKQQTDTSGVGHQYATTRQLSFGPKEATQPANSLDHNSNIYQIAGRNRKGKGVEASPAWVMVGYGICLDSQCGDP